MTIHLRMIAYAMAGITVEVIFTALKEFYRNGDIMLHGTTQLWIIPVYTLGGFSI